MPRQPLCRHFGSARDTISLTGMSFHGRHGVFDEERALGQRFEVDVSMRADVSAAAQTDDVEKTVAYQEVYSLVKSHVEGRPKALLESLCVNVARDILSSHTRVDEVTVTLRKPSVPIAGILAHASVEVSRDRQWLEALTSA